MCATWIHKPVAAADTLHGQSIFVRRCRGPEIVGGREDGLVVGEPVHVQGTPTGRRDVPRQSVQFFRKAVRMEMLRLPLHRVSRR